MKQLNIAVVGAASLVGETILSILEERVFPVAKMYPLTHQDSPEKPIEFNGESLTIEEVADFDFGKADIAFFAGDINVAKKYIPLAATENCIVIDSTSFSNQDENIPMIVPEVNCERIGDYKHKNILAIPSSAAIPLLVALKPIYDAVGITRINVATYQAVSSTGKEAISELVDQTVELLNGRPAKNAVYQKQIAFNVLPQVDDLEENGYTVAEMNIIRETRRVLNNSSIEINVTAVQVPVLYGHSEALHIETGDKLSTRQAQEILKQAPGIIVVEDEKKLDYPTAITEAGGEDAVYIGRIREDISCDRGLNLWVVSDNVRKGAALNAVQIAEILLNHHF